jgi:site-specific recombinase XerD
VASTTHNVTRGKEVPADPWVVAFLRDNERRNLSKHTIGDRRRLLGRYVQAILPADPTTVSREQIERWLDGLNIGPRSRHSYISSLAAFHQWLEEAGHRDDDPTRRIRRPKLGRLLPRPIQDADLEYALSVADARMRAWLCLAAYDGLRCAEIAALRREDVVLDREPPLLIVRQGKGKKDRIVPLNPIVEEALRSYGLGTGYLFRLNNGQPISAGTVSSYVCRFLHDHNIDASAHRGRHRFGTDAYAASDGDLRIVQELMGHADPKTTAIYADFDPVKAAAVVRKLGVKKGAADATNDTQAALN